MTDKTRILETIRSPRQLRKLTDEQLTQLTEELRARIIEVVASRGGHLASNLGITELTLAMHYVFDFQTDRLLWDVGHQCYAHKILTGRGDKFDSLRQMGGISGFPSPGESPYDLFYTGHAGTAISTAAGLAWADHAAARDTKVVAVVGDASIVNGLSLEGLNNAAMLKRQLLIILNDNSMAIDRTQGALAAAMDRVRSTNTYSEMKQSAETVLHHIPLGEEIADALRNLKAGLRTSLHGGTIFETLGFAYFGPVDGHNTRDLIRMLQRLSKVDRPVVLHVHTQKGRGAEYAVEDPCRFHSPSAYTIHDGKAVFESKAHPNWTSVFGEALADLGAQNKKVVAITAAMPDGTGLTKFREKFPDRFIDVGINESHAVAMAAGLARAGFRPVVAVYSTFMQRAFDQVFQEAALQKLPIVLCMDRAGLVGADGAVHQGFVDIAMLRPLPGITLMAPADAAEMKASLELAMTLDGPCAIRYPRDEVMEDLPDECPAFEPGKARTLREGADGTFLCYGTTVEPALEAATQLEQDRLRVGVVNARFAKPLDVPLVTRLIASGKPLVICEEHAIAGGFGSAVLELAASRGLNASQVRLLGMPDRFVEHASRQEQLTEVGLDSTSLAATMKDLVRQAADKAAKRLL